MRTKTVRGMFVSMTQCDSVRPGYEFRSGTTEHSTFLAFLRFNMISTTNYSLKSGFYLSREIIGN